MKPEASLHLAKAQKLVATARSLLKDGYPNDAARDAYLAAYHAAQAYIVDHTGKAAKTHSGAHSQFAQLASLEPSIPPDLCRFLAQAYTLKAIVDYEFGEGADIPPARAAASVETATTFIACLTDLLDKGGE